MSNRTSVWVVTTLSCLAASLGAVPPAVAQAPPTITITAPTSEPTHSASGASLTLEGTTTGSVESILWRSDRGDSGLVSGVSPWYAPEVPLLAGVNVLTVTASGPGGTATDSLTVTVTTLAYHLAEGATGPFFDLDLALANPNDVAAPVAIAYFTEQGTTVTQGLTLPAASSRLIRVDTIPGLESTALSTVVTSTSGLPLVVERTMRWSDEAQYGSHTDKATAGAARTWYFAEGSQGFFHTYLLLANPGASSNRATVDWLIEGAPAVQRTYMLPPQSRVTIAAGSDPALVQRSFGIKVTFDEPAAAERAMYFGLPPQPLFVAGHESAGATGPSTHWILPEGATGPYFETFILLANPNADEAFVMLTFLPDQGPSLDNVLTIPGHGRQTVNLEALSPTNPYMANAAVATTVVASLPIVVERAQYWPGPPSSWQEAHNSFGVTATGTRWGLAEGRVGNPPGLPPADYQTYILLANPGLVPAHVTIRFLRQDGGTLWKSFTVPAQRRTNVAITGAVGDVPELADETFGAVIASDQPIAVERALYANAGGVVWSAGSNATATRLPVEGLIFEDPFQGAGPRLDLAAWTTEIGPSSYLGRTQLADWVTPGGVGMFAQSGGAAVLTLETFNPTGFSLYGTHAKTLMSFQPTATTVIELTARVELQTIEPGLVYGVYFYGCPGPCATRHDEIDIELVTNRLQPGGPLQVQINRYIDEPSGAGHGGLVPLPAGFDPLAPHDWTIRWSRGRIDYFVDGVPLGSATDYVPQGPMHASLIAWGPDQGWPAAYNAGIQAVAAPADNRRFVALVHSIHVRRLPL